MCKQYSIAHTHTCTCTHTQTHTYPLQAIVVFFLMWIILLMTLSSVRMRWGCLCACPCVVVGQRCCLCVNNLLLAYRMTCVVTQLSYEITVQHLHIHTESPRRAHTSPVVMSQWLCCLCSSCGHPDEAGVLSKEILDCKQTGTHAQTRRLKYVHAHAHIHTFSTCICSFKLLSSTLLFAFS